MNPLLLLALVGGGAVVAYKVLGKHVKVLTPPENPFFLPGGLGIDWANVSETLGSFPEKEISPADKAKMAYVVAGISAVNPAFGMVASLIAKGLIKIDDLLAVDQNGQRFVDELQRIHSNMTSHGWIPPMVREDQTLAAQVLALGDGLSIRPKSPETMNYHEWLIEQGGALFKKWGGEPKLVTYGTTFLVGVNQYLGSQPMMIAGDTKELAVKENEPRLVLAAISVAYELGVQDWSEDVVASALEACRSHHNIAVALKFEDYGYSVQPNDVLMSYAFGMYAAYHKAASIAGLASIPVPGPKAYNRLASEVLSGSSPDDVKPLPTKGSSSTPATKDSTPTTSPPKTATIRKPRLPSNPSSSAFSTAPEIITDQGKRIRVIDRLPLAVEAEDSSPANNAYRESVLSAYNTANAPSLAAWVVDLRARGFDRAAATMSARAIERGYTGADLHIPNPAIEDLSVDELPKEYDGDADFKQSALAVFYAGTPGIDDAKYAVYLHKLGFDAAAYQFLGRARRAGFIHGIENLAAKPPGT
jgi:hypothetical protein